jgi:hypothetical protein
MKKVKIFFLALAIGTGFTGCKKWLDIGPEGAILAEDAINTPEDLQKLLNSCYDVLGNVYDGNVQNMAELLSDNLARPLNNLDLTSVYDREVTFFNSTTNAVYADLYRAIYRSNELIRNVELVQNLSAEESTRIQAEARFIRALCHYWVLKLWAQPWGSTPDNSHLGIVIRDEAGPFPKPRSSVKESYEFIIADIQFAFDNLPSTNPGYADRLSAAGLMAQVLFQKMDYNGAITFANEVINSGRYSLRPDLDAFQAFTAEGYLTPNPESVFEINSFVGNGIIDARNEGFRNNYWPGASGSQLSYSLELNNFFNLSPQDGRIAAWLNEADGQVQTKRFGSNANESFFFSIPIIRLTHLHLIRAEAIGMVNGDLNTAIEDINAIRDRAYGVGLNDMPAGATAQQIINAAREEFRKETISEGYRIDQIKRIGASGENIVVRGAPWNCPGMAIQFPNSEFTGSEFVGNPEGGC